MNFYPRNISSKMQLKKFMTRRERLLFFFFPLAHHFHTGTQREARSGHSVCELLTTRSCIRCTRCIHTHTYTHTHTHHTSDHLVAHYTNEHAKFPHRRATGRTHFRNWMFESGRPTFDHMRSLLSKLVLDRTL